MVACTLNCRFEKCKTKNRDVLLPPLHIELKLVKKFVKAINNEGNSVFSNNCVVHLQAIVMPKSNRVSSHNKAVPTKAVFNMLQYNISHGIVCTRRFN